MNSNHELINSNLMFAHQSIRISMCMWKTFLYSRLMEPFSLFTLASYDKSSIESTTQLTTDAGLESIKYKVASFCTLHSKLATL